MPIQDGFTAEIDPYPRDPGRYRVKILEYGFLRQVEITSTRWGARRLAKRKLKYYQSGKYDYDNRTEIIR